MVAIISAILVGGTSAGRPTGGGSETSVAVIDNHRARRSWIHNRHQLRPVPIRSRIGMGVAGRVEGIVRMHPVYPGRIIVFVVADDVVPIPWVYRLIDQVALQRSRGVI